MAVSVEYLRQSWPPVVWGWIAGAALVLLAQGTAVEAGSPSRPALVTPEQGIASQSKAIRKNPKNLSAYLRRAGHHLTLAKTEQGNSHLRAAADDLARAAQLAPKDATIHRRYADTAAALHEYQLAVTEYSAAIKLEPRRAASYLDRGLAYLSLRQDRLAKIDFKRALKLNPALRRRLELEERRIRMARLTQDVELRFNQRETQEDRTDGHSPDLPCSGAIPIHWTAQCHSVEERAIVP